MESLSNLTVLRPQTVNNLEYQANLAQWQIELSDRTIAAKLLIAADGSNSLIHNIENLAVQVKDYAQTAIVTNVRVDTKIPATAFERFTAQGVLALLPFGAKQLKCVWTMHNSGLAKFMQCPNDEFLSKLQYAMGYRLGKFVSMDERKAFPIIKCSVQQLYGTASILLGNAANTLHPVAAQGFNLGIRDVIALANVLAEAVKLGVAINSPEVLNNYSKLRAHDHQETINFSNSLVEIFASDLLFAKISRRVGLVAAQILPLLKKKILAKGLGVCM